MILTIKHVIKSNFIHFLKICNCFGKKYFGEFDKIKHSYRVLIIYKISKNYTIKNRNKVRVKTNIVGLRAIEESGADSWFKSTIRSATSGYTGLLLSI